MKKLLLMLVLLSSFSVVKAVNPTETSSTSSKDPISGSLYWHGVLYQFNGVCCPPEIHWWGGGREGYIFYSPKHEDDLPTVPVESISQLEVFFNIENEAGADDDLVVSFYNHIMFDTE